MAKDKNVKTPATDVAAIATNKTPVAKTEPKKQDSPKEEVTPINVKVTDADRIKVISDKSSLPTEVKAALETLEDKSLRITYSILVDYGIKMSDPLTELKEQQNKQLSLFSLFSSILKKERHEVLQHVALIKYMFAQEDKQSAWSKIKLYRHDIVFKGEKKDQFYGLISLLKDGGNPSVVISVFKDSKQKENVSLFR